VTIQEVLREWRAHLPPKPRPPGIRGLVAVALGWLASALVYAVAVAIVLGVPMVAVILLLRAAYG
jgi:hypothetical protein